MSNVGLSWVGLWKKDPCPCYRTTLDERWARVGGRGVVSDLNATAQFLVRAVTASDVIRKMCL